ATSAAANESQSCPPSGRMSTTTAIPSAVAENASAGKIVTTATSSGCDPARSRQTAGTSAAATSRYAPASRNNGRALSSTDSVPVLTGFEWYVRGLQEWAGRPIGGPPRLRYGRPALGKCEPRSVARSDRLRTALEKALYIDPPSSEPSPCFAGVARGRGYT